MIIECQRCHARFRLDATKIRGKGARVKCRKCGDVIIVLRDEETGVLSQEPGGEGSLDLGSVLREASKERISEPPASPSPNNLIPFPGATRAPEEVERDEKDEVDIAFEQLLEQSGHPQVPAIDAASSGEEPRREVGGSSTPSEEAPLPEPSAAAPAETWEREVELAPLLPEGPAQAEEPPARAGEGFLVSDSETLDFLGENAKAPEEAPRADISDAIAAAPLELDAPPASQLEATAFPPAADFIPPTEDLPLEGNVTPSPSAQGVGQPEVPVGSTSPEPPPRRPVPGPYLEPLSRDAPPSRSASSLPMATVVVLLVVGAAAAGYFGFTASGKKSLTDLAPRVAALFGGKWTAGSASRYEVKNVIGYYESGAAAPRILVIKGQVTNLSKIGKSGIRVHATLLDSNEQVLGDKTVYAGNTLSTAKLKAGDRSTLEKALGNPLGERLSNMDVQPGKAIPFMVLFFDAPENIDSYRLEAMDNE
jgi:predicted Zn finger-like uncharacterized protein